MERENVNWKKTSAKTEFLVVSGNGIFYGNHFYGE
jgi:hypothetical protein